MARFARQSWSSSAYLMITFVANLLLLGDAPAMAALFRWDTSQSIPNTENIVPQPGVVLDGLRLDYVSLSFVDLTGASFRQTHLTGGYLSNSIFRNADFTGALISDTFMANVTPGGFTQEQLYSTASYQQKNLRGIRFFENNFRGWSFPGQDLTGALFEGADLAQTDFSGANLTHTAVRWSDLTSANFANANLREADLRFSKLAAANFQGAVVNYTNFQEVTALGFTREQLYSTASYQQKDLRGTLFQSNDLTGWDFRGQNLTDATFSDSNLTNTNFQDALIEKARFFSGRLAKEQLYSTASYRSKQLREIDLTGATLVDWNLSDQDLSAARFLHASLRDMDFRRANLSNADLRWVALESSQLADANLANAAIDFAVLRNLTSGGFRAEQLYSTVNYLDKNLSNIDLSQNDFAAINLSNQNLYQARLIDSNLTHGNFVGANLSWANLTGANLTSADLRGVNLENTNLTGANLTGVIVDATTRYNPATSFPAGFDPIAAGLTNVSLAPGDFDGDKVLGENDIQLLSQRILGIPTGNGIPDGLFDLNRDQQVDGEDHRVWVQDLKKTWYGDANLDGQFDSSDFVQVFAWGKYEYPETGPAYWSQGDWNIDGRFDSGDFIAAFAGGGFEAGPRPQAVAVPEPRLAVMNPLLFWTCLAFGRSVVSRKKGAKQTFATRISPPTDAIENRCNHEGREEHEEEIRRVSD